jgi:hypothetical protein
MRAKVGETRQVAESEVAWWNVAQRGAGVGSSRYFGWCLDAARPCAAGGGGVRSVTMDAPRVNLYLVGFAGTGKSTVGRHAARTLGYTLLDVDHEIERIESRASRRFARWSERSSRTAIRSRVASCLAAAG